MDHKKDIQKIYCRAALVTAPIRVCVHIIHKPGVESNFVQQRMEEKNNFYSFQSVFGSGCV